MILLIKNILIKNNKIKHKQGQLQIYFPLQCLITQQSPPSMLKPYKKQISSVNSQINFHHIQQLQRERLLHIQRVANYENALSQSYFEGRRLQLRRIMEERIQEERRIRLGQQESIHLDYTAKIDKLREERERLRKEILERRVTDLNKTADSQQLRKQYLNQFQEKSYKPYKPPSNSYFSLNNSKKERWAPFDKKQQIKQKQIEDNEKYLIELGSKVEQLKNRKPSKQEEKEKKHVTFRLEQNQQKEYGKMDLATTEQIPRKNKSKKAHKTQVQKPSPAWQRIRNRIQLSQVVFEDSQHRVISHEIQHLKMKYKNQQKQRKQLIDKIFNHKKVSQVYAR